MAVSDAPAVVGAAASTKSETETAQSGSSNGTEFDIVASYKRLLAEDPDLTKPVAAIEALIDVLRHTPSSTAMETYEIAGAQVERLHAAVPNALPIEAGTSLFTNFLSMSMRQPSADVLSALDESFPSSSGGGGGGGSNAGGNGPSTLDSFDKIRQHLLDNSQLFVQRAKDARDRIAERGCRLVGEGDVVLTAGGSRAVRALLLRAAARLRAAADGSVSADVGPSVPSTVAVTVAAAAAAAAAAATAADKDKDEGDETTQQDDTAGSGAEAPFTVLYVCDERSRDESDRAIAILRRHRIAVVEIDPSAVAYALEAHNVRSVFVGSEAVTHDGKLVSRIGTYQLALLAQAAKPPRRLYALAETHKFVRKLLLNNSDLPRIGIQQGFLPAGPAPTRAGVPLSTKPALAYQEQVDVTPPYLVTNIITENGIIEPSGSYRIVSY